MRIKTNLIFILFLVSLFVISVSSKAQFLKTTRLGFNLFSISDAPTVIPKTDFVSGQRVGLSFGRGIKYKVSPRIALQMECMYLFKEAAASISYILQSGDTLAYSHTESFSSRLHYIYLPVVLQYRYNFKNGVVLFGNAGFFSAVKLFERTNEPGLNELAQPGKSDKYFQNADFGGVVGLGTAFTFDGKIMIAPEIRLTQSIGNNPNYVSQRPTLEFSIGYVTTFGE